MNNRMLFTACMAADIHIQEIKSLLEKGASVDAKNNYGNTPLHLAAWNRHPAVVKLLLENEASIDAKNNDGETSLHIAIRRGHPGMVNLLLENGANVDAENNYGETPLHTAAWNRNLAIVKLLLENGANFYAKNNQNKTPKEYASNEDIKNHLTNLEESVIKMFNAHQQFDSLVKTYFSGSISSASLQVLINKAISEETNESKAEAKLHLKKVIVLLESMKQQLENKLQNDIKELIPSEVKVPNEATASASIFSLFKFKHYSHEPILSVRCPALLNFKPN